MKHAFYSEEAAQRFGYFICLDLAGNEVKATAMFGNKDNGAGYRWRDAIYVGMVRRAIGKYIVLVQEAKPIASIAIAKACYGEDPDAFKREMMGTAPSTHAFFSQEAADEHGFFIYRRTSTDERVKVTAVYNSRVDGDANYKFKDKVYVGLVDEFPIETVGQEMSPMHGPAWDGFHAMGIHMTTVTTVAPVAPVMQPVLELEEVD